MNVRRVIENQRDIFNILKRAKDTDRLSHAYLFYGASGTGKKEMAYALACLLYCENKEKVVERFSFRQLFLKIINCVIHCFVDLCIHL